MDDLIGATAAFLLACLVLAGCAAPVQAPAPWYVCGQRVVKETGQPVLLCQPMDGGAIRQVPAPSKDDERT